MENYIQQIQGTSLIKHSSRWLWHLALIKYLQNLQNIVSDIERLSLASFSSLVYCLWIRAGAYPRVEHLKGCKKFDR
jgi:hypothetical protein